MSGPVYKSGLDGDKQEDKIENCLVPNRIQNSMLAGTNPGAKGRVLQGWVEVFHAASRNGCAVCQITGVNRRALITQDLVANDRS